jgi:hypothetical protein
MVMCNKTEYFQYTLLYKSLNSIKNLLLFILLDGIEDRYSKIKGETKPKAQFLWHIVH